LASATYSKLCSVNALPGAVASVMPATPFFPFSVCAAFSIASYVVGGCSPAASNRSLR
jgi:hypothetical protein